LLVKQDVGRLHGAMVDSQVMQVGQGGSHRGAKPGDNLDGLPPQAAQIPGRYSPQDQAVRGVTSFDAEQLDDARMSHGSQYGGLMLELPAFGGGLAPLVEQSRPGVGCDFHCPSNYSTNA
jgi:hypothetical protein